MFLNHCRYGLLLLIGFALALSCAHSRPDAPAVPVGPTSVEVDSMYTYKASASISKQYEEYGLVWVRFDWGDGDTSMWCGHGETVESSHSWRKGGVFKVRAQAHDDRSEFSEWSAPCSVTAVVPSYPYRLIDSVAIPDAMEAQVSPNGEYVYVAVDFDASLSVVRTSDLQVVAQIPFYCSWWAEAGGGGGGRMVCSPDGEYVYANLYRGDYLAVVRTADEVVVDSLFLGDQDPDGTSFAISPDGKRLFVPFVNDDSAYLVVVGEPENRVEDTIPKPGGFGVVSSMKVATDGSRLYAEEELDDLRVCAVRLSDKSIEWEVPAQVATGGPGALVLHPTGNPLYVLEDEGITVRESGTGSAIDTISPPSRWNWCWNAAVAPDGSYLYVTCGDGAYNGALAVVRTADNRVVRVITMPAGVCDVAPSPDGQRLYVAGGNGLYVLSR